MATDREIKAVRALNKFLTISTEGWDEAQSADSKYDGGEFSLPAWGVLWEKEIDRAIAIVARRFRMPIADLGYAFEMSIYHNEQCFRESIEQVTVKRINGHAALEARQ